MSTKAGLPLFAAGLLAATVVFAPCASSAAQERPAISTDFSAQQQQENKGQQKKAAPAARSAPQRAAPQRAAPQRAAPQRAAPQRAAPQRAAPQRAAPQRSAPREAAPRRAQPRIVSPQRTAPSEITPRRTAPSTITRQKAAPRVARPSTAAPRVVIPSGTRTVTAARLRGVPARGAGRAVIHGQNYSAWRSGYRVRYGGGWRTFVALSALGAIAIGSSQYYPYAYISAPRPYCVGLTEDGCELMWQEVETIEGDVINQCVAYCPWQ